MALDINRLPLAVTSFKEFIQENCIYVDKTDLIAAIAKSKAPCFLSRPRRFGKSTLVDTLYELFSHGLETFTGLKIDKEKLWTDKNTYKVLHLDFSTISANIEWFNTVFINEIDKKSKKLNLKQDPNNSLVSIFPNECLQSYLELLEDEKIILLIDEYDAPLTANLDNKESFNKIRETLSELYKTIKAYNKNFKFIFITGVTRYSQTSIFSAFLRIVISFFIAKLLLVFW